MTTELGDELVNVSGLTKRTVSIDIGIVPFDDPDVEALADVACVISGPGGPSIVTDGTDFQLVFADSAEATTDAAGQASFLVLPSEHYVVNWPRTYTLTVGSLDPIQFVMPDSDLTHLSLFLAGSAPGPDANPPGQFGWIPSPTAPIDPVQWLGWIDTSDSSLQIWDGTKWEPVGGGGGLTEVTVGNLAGIDFPPDPGRLVVVDDDDVNTFDTLARGFFASAGSLAAEASTRRDADAALGQRITTAHNDLGNEVAARIRRDAEIEASITALPVWHTGSAAPKGTDGKQGDFWLRSEGTATKGEIWEKITATEWLRLLEVTDSGGAPSSESEFRTLWNLASAVTVSSSVSADYTLSAALTDDEDTYKYVLFEMTNRVGNVRVTVFDTNSTAVYRTATVNANSYDVSSPFVVPLARTNNAITYDGQAPWLVELSSTGATTFAAVRIVEIGQSQQDTIDYLLLNDRLIPDRKPTGLYALCYNPSNDRLEWHARREISNTSGQGPRGQGDAIEFVETLDRWKYGVLYARGDVITDEANIRVYQKITDTSTAPNQPPLSSAHDWHLIGPNALWADDSNDVPVPIQKMQLEPGIIERPTGEHFPADYELDYDASTRLPIDILGPLTFDTWPEIVGVEAEAVAISAGTPPDIVFDLRDGDGNVISTRADMEVNGGRLYHQLLVNPGAAEGPVYLAVESVVTDSQVQGGSGTYVIEIADILGFKGTEPAARLIAQMADRLILSREDATMGITQAEAIELINELVPPAQRIPALTGHGGSLVRVADDASGVRLEAISEFADEVTAPWARPGEPEPGGAHIPNVSKAVPLYSDHAMTVLASQAGLVVDSGFDLAPLPEGELLIRVDHPASGHVNAWTGLWRGATATVQALSGRTVSQAAADVAHIDLGGTVYAGRLTSGNLWISVPLSAHDQPVTVTVLHETNWPKYFTAT